MAAKRDVTDSHEDNQQSKECRKPVDLPTKVQNFSLEVARFRLEDIRRDHTRRN